MSQHYPLAAALRRKRIVEAAQRMFAETAYAAVQMDDVARAAGVAKPTLYRYFATKEELFLEGLDTMLCDLAAEADMAARDSGDAVDALAKGISIVLNTLGRCTAAVRAFDGSDTGLGDRGRAIIRERVKHIRDTFAEVVRRGIRDGAFRAVEPEIAALAVLGAIRMTASNVSLKRHGLAACTLTDILLQGLSADGGRVLCAEIRSSKRPKADATSMDGTL